MTRSDLLGLITVGALALPIMGCPSGGVGDPCIPEDEYREGFAGFKLEEENVESRSFQCRSRICLVNHFQGRVSCPLGQAEPKRCTGDSDCAGLDENNDGNSDEQVCTEAGIIQDVPCDPGQNAADGSNPVCPAAGSYTCACAGIPADEPQNCAQPVCVAQVCSAPSLDWRCYLPGTDVPVITEVCSQCGNRQASQTDSNDNAAVYCSCRCGPAEAPCSSDGDCDTDLGEICDTIEINGREVKNCTDPNFNFCECPDGYTCEEIRPNVGLGDKQISGRYCIKDGTLYAPPQSECGTVLGHHAGHCSGTIPTD